MDEPSDGNATWAVYCIWKKGVSIQYVSFEYLFIEIFATAENHAFGSTEYPVLQSLLPIKQAS